MGAVATTVLIAEMPEFGPLSAEAAEKQPKLEQPRPDRA